MIDLTLNKTGLENNIKKARENKIVIPTYEQMKHPETIPDKIKKNLLEPLIIIPPIIGTAYLQYA